MAIEDITPESGDPAALQAELDRAEPGSIVHLPATRIRANFVISKPLTLRGAGADRTILDGGGRGPTISVDARDAEVRIEELAITGGRGALGGGLAIDNGASVFVVGCLLERNQARSGRGGAIHVDSGALFVSESTIARNRALVGGGISIGGHARAEIVASIIADNHALRGGGLAVTDDAEVDVWTSRLEQNLAELEGHHLFTYGTRAAAPRILLSNAVLSATGAAGLAISNVSAFKATLAIDNSTVGREHRPLMLVG